MPLLRKKEFQKSTIPELLRDDEEVFHCVVTNEIFRDYDEFCQRIILVNSMVWSCAMTGKSNLTYAEALQSEQSAKKSLKDFPMELRIPVLFLASKTKRSGFGEMAEDVFAYVKDRYFVGENIESSFTENNWRDSYVLQVIAPTNEQIDEYNKSNNTNGKSPERNFSPPAALFRYEVEQLDANDQDSSQVMIVEANHVRRKKGPFTKEKLRLFLKQFVELKDNGIICIKESVKRKYKFENVRFDQLFDGPLPEFEQTKRVNKLAVNGKIKKVRQESIATFLTKGNAPNGKANGKLFMEEMKRKEAEYKQKLEEMKQKRIEEKQKQKEESMKIATLVKDWNRPRDDLLLEDQKPLINSTKVISKIPEKYFGDALMILDFVNSFTSVIHTKDFFPGGLTLELLERALTETELAGPLSDIIQMLLTTIFKIQDVEATESKHNLMELNADDPTLPKEIRLATLASNWSVVYQGLALNHLPLYPVTTSEILRLHLLSSGARINETAAKWRYQQRGGYCSEDDPGLQLCREHPHIPKALSVLNVNTLPIDDKIAILTCLVNQLLTYADVRDSIEERIDKTKNLKAELRSLQASEKKIEADLTSAKFKIKKEHKTNNELMRQELEKADIEFNKKRAEIEQRINKILTSLPGNQTSLGMDRCYQKYIKIKSLPAFFIENDEQFPGYCLDRTTTQKPELIDAGQEETLNYVKQLHEENSSSDKENDNGLKKTPKKINGSRNSVKSDNDIVCARNLSMCTANNHPCPVHTNNKRPSWGFLHDPSDIEALINCLNKRGVREGELRETMEMEKEHLERIVWNTYAPKLNPSVEVHDETREKYNTRKIPKALRYEDSHFGYPTNLDISEIVCLSLIDSILEMEEKIHAGSLGQLKVKDRNAWRNNLNKRNFKELDKTITNKKDENNLQVEKIKGEGKNNNSRPNTPDNSTAPKDVLKYFKVTSEMNGQYSDDVQEDLDDETEALKDERNAVKTLANVLMQVAQSIESKFLLKPLGSGDTTTSKKREKSNVLNRWEQSLMSSTSYSQVYLHYCTLDNCIMWRRSALVARCKICRRKGDGENMLLCDNCNQGHHLYCLKPKLTTIPKGDWFCDKCKPKEEPIESSKPTRKARKIFTEDDDDNDDNDSNEVESEDNYEEEESADESGEESKVEVSVFEVCEECGSGGHVICCDFCPKVYHLECTQPVLRRVPRGEWKCHRCRKKRSTNNSNSNNRSSSSNSNSSSSSSSNTNTNTTTNNKKQDKHDTTVTSQNYNSNDSDSLNGSMEDVALSERAAAATTSATASHLFRRRCATQARTKIHGFTRTLRRTSVDSDSGEEYTQHRRSTRRAHDSKGGDGDLPLNNAALQELLADVMKHKDAWPFTRPVTKQEVPDYFDVIKNPMDFGTIKYKLNMGEYHHDAQVMLEAALVFENCDTYNHSEADVYKCGIRLLKYFEKRARDLGFNFPKNVMGNVESDDDDDDDDGPSPPKKSRH